MKDYYQTLGIAPKASFEEIKKAYRSLVHRYHPDKNSGASSSIIFQEIQEAYTVLSDSRQKQLYDEERFFSGFSSKKKPPVVSAQWILQLARELYRHTSSLQSCDINHNALQAYTLLILSETNYILTKEERQPFNKAIINELMRANKKIQFKLYIPIHERLLVWANGDMEMIRLIENQFSIKKKEDLKRKRFPWFIIIIVLMICISMYFFAGK